MPLAICALLQLKWHFLDTHVWASGIRRIQPKSWDYLAVLCLCLFSAHITVAPVAGWMLWYPSVTVCVYVCSVLGASPHEGGYGCVAHMA